MKPLAKFIGAALVGALALFAAPAAQAQVGVNIASGPPAWGPQVPYGTQYYYIPEIDGYYDLYNQQYIVYQDGYWVPLPQLYGYDPYQFHPVIVDYRGAQPWLRVDYYRQRYAYRPYRNYGPSRAGYYHGGYGYGGSYGRPRYDNRGGYFNGRSYGDRDRGSYRGGYRGNDNRDRDHDDRDGYRGNDRDNRGQYSGGNNNPRSNQLPQQPQQGGGGYNPSQGNHGGGQGGNNNGDRHDNGDGHDNGGNHGGNGNRGGGGHGRS